MAFYKQWAYAQRRWPPAYLVVCKQESRKPSGGIAGPGGTRVYAAHLRPLEMQGFYGFARSAIAGFRTSLRSCSPPKRANTPRSLLLSL